MPTLHLLAGLLAMTASATQPPEPACQARWEIDRSDSVLAEHRAQGVKVDDFAAAYPAQTPAMRVEVP